MEKKKVPKIKTKVQNVRPESFKMHTHGTSVLNIADLQSVLFLEAPRLSCVIFC